VSTTARTAYVAATRTYLYALADVATIRADDAAATAATHNAVTAATAVSCDV
jgi:hypothetical protein